MAAEHVGSYAFYERDVWVRSWATFGVAAVSFVIIAVMAWRGGRTYCNTVCPVGTLLGILSRFSWLKIRLDTDKCTGCRLCERNCKSACIDIKNRKVDYSRCVVCGDCLDKCRFGGLTYTSRRPAKTADAPSRKGDRAEVDTSKRAFLLGAVTAAATAAIAEDKVKFDGGLAKIEDKADTAHPARLNVRPPHGATLYRVPALRRRVSQRRAAAVHKSRNVHAARHVIRARLLPSGVHTVL